MEMARLKRSLNLKHVFISGKLHTLIMEKQELKCRFAKIDFEDSKET